MRHRPTQPTADVLVLPYSAPGVGLGPIAFEIYPMTGRYCTMTIKSIIFAFATLCVGLLGAVPNGNAASGPGIDADVDLTLAHFYDQVYGSRELVDRAAGVLVFPSVVKAGMGFGGEYGEGALRIPGPDGLLLQYRICLVRLSARRAGPVGDHPVHDT